MERIDESTDVAGLLGRFFDFTDSLLHSLSLRFSRQGNQRLEVRIATREAVADETNGWTVGVFVVDNIIEMKFEEHWKRKHGVISDGIHVVKIGELVGIEFGNSYEKPMSMNDLQESECFALGKELWFGTEPYTEEIWRFKHFQ